MIVAKSGTSLIEAERDTDKAGPYSCPLCAHPVVLKPGRVKVPHFAHRPGATCPAGEHEGAEHLAAKKVLAHQFRQLGYTVQLEEIFGAQRRVDVAVTMPTGHRVAVEVQDSPISVDEMKLRMAIDRRNGFFATLWVWIGKRRALLSQAEFHGEGRIPEEMRWLDNRLHVGVYGLQVDFADLSMGIEDPVTPEHFTFGRVDRDGHDASWYETGGEEMSVSYPGRTLKSTKSVGSREVTFRLAAREARYHRPGNPDWTVVFV